MPTTGPAGWVPRARTHDARHTLAHTGTRHPPTTCAAPHPKPNRTHHPTTHRAAQTPATTCGATRPHGARGLDATYTSLTTHDIHWRTAAQDTHHDMRCVTPQMPAVGPAGWAQRTPLRTTQKGTAALMKHPTPAQCRTVGPAGWVPRTPHPLCTSTYTRDDMRCVTPHMPNRGPRGLGATYTPPTVHEHIHPR